MTPAVFDDKERPFAVDERHPRRNGRYVLYAEIAAGGAGSVKETYGSQVKTNLC
jgi:hypothetical protein